MEKVIEFLEQTLESYLNHFQKAPSVSLSNDIVKTSEMLIRARKVQDELN